LVPVREQWLSAGAALGNILSAAHLLGFGAIVLSGERCQDEALRTALGVAAGEALAGFISIGSIAKAPPPAARPPRDLVWSSWETNAVRTARQS
jgi:nitroreductase